MTDDDPVECPECNSTEISEPDDMGEYVCKSCGYVVAVEPEESDSAPEWRAFNETEREESDQSHRLDAGFVSMEEDRLSEWQERHGEQRQRQAERELAYQEAVEQRESTPEPPRTWESSFGSLLICQDGIAYLYRKDEICAIEAETGDRIWETKVENSVTPSSVDLLTSPNVQIRVVRAEVIIVQINQKNIIGIGVETGEHLWRRSLTEAFDGKISADGERVYIAGELGQLQTLDIETGETLWSVTDSYPETDWQSWFPTPPIVTNNLVISTVNTHDGWVLAREKTTGNDRWRFALRETPAPPIKTTEDQVLAPTVTGDVFALDLGDGTQDWRYRLPEYDGRQEKTRPRTPVDAIGSPGSYHLVTGQGFYAALIDSTSGEEVLELSSIGDEVVSDSEPIFDRPPLMFDGGSTTVTFAGQVARAYDFADEVEDSARRWHFRAQDRSRVEPVAVNERYIAIPDRKESLCLLEIKGGEPNAHMDLETSVDALDVTGSQLVVETAEKVASFDCS